MIAGGMAAAVLIGLVSGSGGRSAECLRFDFNPEHVPAGAAAMPPAEVPSPGLLVQGTSLRVRLDRPFARAQDRWIDALLRLAPGVELRKTRLEVKLFALGDTEPLATASVVPGAEVGWLSVDLRRNQRSAAEVAIDYFEAGARTASARLLLRAQPAAYDLVDKRVPVALDVPEGQSALRAWPVTFGVPFAPEALWDVAGLRLVDRAGREIPCQKEITGRWADEGAIQWVRRVRQEPVRGQPHSRAICRSGLPGGTPGPL